MSVVGPTVATAAYGQTADPVIAGGNSIGSLRVSSTEYKLLVSFTGALMQRNRDERLQIMLSPHELTAIDDFRYLYRLPSRAAAVRELLKRGLAAEQTGPVDHGSRSKDFGVLETNNGSSFTKKEG